MSNGWTRGEEDALRVRGLLSTDEEEATGSRVDELWKRIRKERRTYRGVNCGATNRGQTMLYLALKRGISDEDRKDGKEVRVWGGVAFWVGAI